MLVYQRVYIFETLMTFVGIYFSNFSGACYAPGRRFAAWLQQRIRVLQEPAYHRDFRWLGR